MPRHTLLSPLAAAVILALAAPAAGAQALATTDSVATTTLQAPSAPSAAPSAALPAPVAATRQATTAGVSVDAFRAARAREAGSAVAQAGSRNQG